MQRQKGQTSVEWVLIMAVVVLGMAFVLLGKASDDKALYKQMIGGWYQSAGERVARAGIKI